MLGRFSGGFVKQSRAQEPDEHRVVRRPLEHRRSLLTSDPLLNGNQRRHLAAYLRLLIEDLTHLKALPALPEPAHVAADAIIACVEHLAREFALPVARDPEPARSARALAETWTMRSYDRRAASLRGHGAVHPQLVERLDPLIDQLQSALRDLSAAGRSDAGRAK